MWRVKCIRAAYEYQEDIVTRSQYIRCAKYSQRVAKVLKHIARHTADRAAFPDLATYHHIMYICI